MTPTYDGTNITTNEVFVSQARAAGDEAVGDIERRCTTTIHNLLQALLDLPSDTYAAGLSSQTTGTEGSCSEGSSHWTQENMPPFVQWMSAQGVSWIDVWRSDIDCPYDKVRSSVLIQWYIEYNASVLPAFRCQNGNADETEPWFIDAIASFLASGP